MMMMMMMEQQVTKDAMQKEGLEMKSRARNFRMTDGECSLNNPHKVDI